MEPRYLDHVIAAHAAMRTRIEAAPFAPSLGAFVDQAAARHGPAPLWRFIETADDVTLRELSYAQQAEQMQGLEEWLEAGGQEPSGGDLSRYELKLALKQALARLQPRQQLLLTLYYEHELNMKEIAAVLQLTESRVCQLHKESVAKLNEALRERG